MCVCAGTRDKKREFYSSRTQRTNKGIVSRLLFFPILRLVRRGHGGWRRRVQNACIHPLLTIYRGPDVCDGKNKKHTLKRQSLGYSLGRAGLKRKKRNEMKSMDKRYEGGKVWKASVSPDDPDALSAIVGCGRATFRCFPGGIIRLEPESSPVGLN